MCTYLEFILFFFFFRYWVSITHWWKDTGLILDKTKIDNCLFLRGLVFSLGIRLTRLPYLGVLSSLQVISFFSLHSLRGIILEFGFLSYPKLCSWFFNEQRQLLMCLHFVKNERLLTMCLHPVMNKWQLTYFCSLKIYHVLIFGSIFLDTKYGRGVCLSADTYMANTVRSSHAHITL